MGFRRISVEYRSVVSCGFPTYQCRVSERGQLWLPTHQCRVSERGQQCVKRHISGEYWCVISRGLPTHQCRVSERYQPWVTDDGALMGSEYDLTFH